MWRNRGIAFKIILSTSVGSGLIFLLILGLHYFSSLKIIVAVILIWIGIRFQKSSAGLNGVNPTTLAVEVRS
jgi:uncharacterized membrane protein